jgi:hypothetical protein
VSTFWRPIAQLRAAGMTPTRVKYLGTGTYVLWCRCDFCTWSGPSTEFVYFHKDPDMCEMCASCGGDETIIRAMLAEGWTVVA